MGSRACAKQFEIQVAWMDCAMSRAERRSYALVYVGLKPPSRIWFDCDLSALCHALIQVIHPRHSSPAVQSQVIQVHQATPSNPFAITSPNPPPSPPAITPSGRQPIQPPTTISCPLHVPTPSLADTTTDPPTRQGQAVQTAECRPASS
jgi:hypothetical protein